MERFYEQFWPKSEGAMPPVAPPVPTPMLTLKLLVGTDIYDLSWVQCIYGD